MRKIKISSKLLYLLFFIQIIIGCSEKDDSPTLKFSKVSTILMPVEGKRIPAPRSITTGKDDKLIVLDNIGRVLVFDKTGKLISKWWMPEYKLGRPEGVCELKDGRIAVTNTHYSKVVIFNPDGKINLIFSKKGDGDGELNNPVGVCEDPDGNLYICEYGTQDRVQHFSTDGKFLGKFGKSGTGPGEFQRPSGLAFRNKNIYIVDAVNNRIQQFEEKGKFIRSITVSPDFYMPNDITFDKDNYIYIVEYGNACVTKLNPDGTLAGRYFPENKLREPWGIAVNSEGTVFVADTGNKRIMVLTP